MRALLFIALSLSASPTHRRFMQPNLPAAVCSVQGAAIIDSNWADFTNTSAVARTVGYGPGFDPGCGSAAERLIIPATTSAQFAGIQNPNGTLCPAATSPLSMGCWIAGTASSGNTDFCTEKSGYTCYPMPFSPVAAFVKVENFTTAGGGANVIIGNISAITGVAHGAVDIQIWGCRCVAGATITP